MPVATDSARSSPSQVLAHLGAPPITPTDDAPQSPSTSQRGPLSGSAISPTRTTGSGCLDRHRHLHTFPFFLSAGREFLG